MRPVVNRKVFNDDDFAGTDALLWYQLITNLNFDAKLLGFDFFF